MDDFDGAAVEAEVRAAFDGYEAALGANDVAALTGYFWQSPRAVRLMTEGGLYGIEAIAAFRQGRDVSDIARELTRVDIVALCARRRRSRPPNTAAPAPAGAAPRARSGSAGPRAGASPRRTSASAPRPVTPPPPRRPGASRRTR